MRKNVLIIALTLLISCDAFCMQKTQCESTSGHPGVVVTFTLGRALDYIDKNTLVLVDLDGTLWQPKQLLGNNGWAYYEGDKYIDLYKEIGEEDYVKKGLEAFRPTWVFVQKNVDMQFIDKNAGYFLKRLKEQEIPVMGFTARGMELVDRTKEQMDGVTGLEFNAPKFSVTESENFIFKHGILFIGIGANKGECLFDFFKENQWAAKKIVFIDDMEKNIDSVSKSCEIRDVPCIPVWFRGEEEFTDEHKEIGDMQLFHLLQYKKVLTDDEARRHFEKTYGRKICSKEK